jgi:hypothetical protein
MAQDEELRARMVKALQMAQACIVRAGMSPTRRLNEPDPSLTAAATSAGFVVVPHFGTTLICKYSVVLTEFASII